ncbi:hypothetical protein Tc00.1047053511573.49 [Trypanosoma cruzi]|uniref:Uncharacterized protein n=1 Tax=Trypanosoma cruzi (strain CL Brener) TaxID=353153 RepID=Q4CU31_TRYCC|nr:hypothetical protein Tc00.1047053511573.49 [Trypanosoma cruzi]EAN83786.1 hypothetical protein Tc00.1047053511573.49 [Trypanosoma cruzi]|eukprot:XP_805637.1 hypothetical protein [Trypanosoma cruzi strain CL Brener]
MSLVKRALLVAVYMGSVHPFRNEIICVCVCMYLCVCCWLFKWWMWWLRSSGGRIFAVMRFCFCLFFFCCCFWSFCRPVSCLPPPITSLTAPGEHFFVCLCFCFFFFLLFFFILLFFDFSLRKKKKTEACRRGLFCVPACLSSLFYVSVERGMAAFLFIFIGFLSSLNGSAAIRVATVSPPPVFCCDFSLGVMGLTAPRLLFFFSPFFSPLPRLFFGEEWISLPCVCRLLFCYFVF